MNPLRLRIHSHDSTWRCDACGAFNNESRQTCAECDAERLAPPTSPQPPEPEKAKVPDTQDFEAKPILLEPTFSEPSASPVDIDEEKEQKEETDLEQPEITPEPQTILEPQTTISSPTPPTGQTRYYLVFVNTPASSLVKSKVPIDFEDFPIISLGRSPENVIVIPDQEVSRKHAELSMDGARLVLKDLKSKNGTYLYNGKEFQQVTDSVQVKPNSLVKFGTGTIVRLTSE